MKNRFKFLKYLIFFMTMFICACEKKSQQKPVSDYEKMAIDGDRGAVYYVVYHYDSYGNYREAQQWRKFAADKGDELMMLNYATSFLLTSVGSEKQAQYYIEKAAQTKNCLLKISAEELELDFLQRKNKGLDDKNYYLKLAKLGSPSAMELLSELYKREDNLIDQYVWLKLYIQSIQLVNLKNIYNKKLEDLKKSLNRAQIESAINKFEETEKDIYFCQQEVTPHGEGGFYGEKVLITRPKINKDKDI